MIILVVFTMQLVRRGYAEYVDSSAADDGAGAAGVGADATSVGAATTLSVAADSHGGVAYHARLDRRPYHLVHCRRPDPCTWPPLSLA